MLKLPDLEGACAASRNVMSCESQGRREHFRILLHIRGSQLTGTEPTNRVLAKTARPLGDATSGTDDFRNWPMARFVKFCRAESETRPIDWLSGVRYRKRKNENPNNATPRLTGQSEPEGIEEGPMFLPSQLSLYARPSVLASWQRPVQRPAIQKCIRECLRTDAVRPETCCSCWPRSVCYCVRSTN